MIIQDRERKLLRELATLAVIDREQAKRVAGFGSTTRANERLLLLVRAGVLRRFFLGIGGRARKALYALSPKGAALVNVPYRGPRRKADETLVADFFVTHQLRVNDLHCTVVYPAPPANGIQVKRWHAFREPLEKGLSLIPDGYFETIAEKTIPAFLEVDLGTERLKVWTRKVHEYLRYATSGAFPKRFGHPQFRVLVVADAEGRAVSLRKATAAVTEKIFWFTTFAAIERDGFWAAIWQRPKDDHRVSLTGKP